MRIYMDKSLDVNFYEDLFSSMAKPRHLEAVKQCVSVFARDVVGAYLNNGQAPDMRPAPAAADGVERCRQEVAALRVSTVVDADGAVSLAPSPTGSADGGPPEIEAIGVPRHVQLHDDLDSDSLLHSTRAIAAAKRKRSQGNIGGVGPSYQWIAAFGKEWINVSKDPAGRQAIVSVVGSATREAVAAVSSTVTEKYSNAFLLAVLLAGVVSAVLLQVMLRAVGGMLVGT